MESIPSVPHNTDTQFYKVAPGLFTPQRLDAFESVELYTSLIQASRRLENGTRLENISWRVLNKAMCRGRQGASANTNTNTNANDPAQRTCASVPGPKKRDGVRSIYYILNPQNQTQLAAKAQQQPQQPQPQKAARSPAPSYKPLTTAELFQRYKPQPKQATREDPQNITEGFDTSAMATATAASATLANSSAAVGETVRGRSGARASAAPAAPAATASTPSLFNSHTNTAQHTPTHSSSFFNQNSAGAQNNKIFFSSEDEYSDWNSISDDDGDYDDDDFYGDDDRASAATPSTNGKHQGSLRSVGGSAAKAGTAAEENSSAGGGQARRRHSLQRGRRHHGARNDTDDFDDDDFDDNEFDDEDDDQYYRKQWDKLMFTKTSHPHAHSQRASGNSAASSAASNYSTDHTKKSLLSGLFSNESANGTGASGASAANSPILSRPRSNTNTRGHSHGNAEHSADTGEPSVAVSLTPPGVSANSRTSGQLPVAPRKAQALTSTTQPPQPSVSTARTHSRTSSFSTVTTPTSVSGSMLRRDRPHHESNAPLTAQTILPTALSTHMFLPNSVHQQRMAAAAASTTGTTTTTTTTSSSTAQPMPKLGGRRLSMDIPSKNRNSGFLKTRMEISVEEKGIRARGKKSSNK